jgi:putative transposase
MPPETYEYKQFSRRTLPHIHSPGATLFVTFRLHGSIPKVVLRQWEHERSDLLKTISVLCDSDINEAIDLALSERVRVFNRQWFAKYEEVLHAASSGPNWLKDAQIAQVVANAFHHLDEQAYGLHAYSIMSNHAHVAFTPLLNERTVHKKPDSARTEFVSTDPTLSAIMKSLKGFTAREANKLIGRKGTFWQAESYDREIRDEAEFWRTIRYILNNPVKAGLVRDWRDYPFSWLTPSLKAILDR